MAAPWEDYQSNTAVAESPPWDDYSHKPWDDYKPDKAGEAYTARVADSIKQQPRTELSPEEKARTGQIYAEPGEVTGGKDQYDPFTGKVASDKPLVSTDAIKKALSAVGEIGATGPVEADPVQEKINKEIADRLSGMTNEKFLSTLPMYAIPGYAEVQGLEGISQSVPELKAGLKEGDPGKITGGSLDSIMAALMLGHRAIPGGKSADVATEVKDGSPKDLQPETPQFRQTPSGPAPIEADLTQKQPLRPQDNPQPMVNRGGPVEPVVEQGGAGISEARTEAELGEGSVEPGVGAELGSGLEYGRNYINKGGDPRLPIRRALTSGLVGKNEVGIVHAELERLRGVRNTAADALEVNPSDPIAKTALDQADAAQRAWRKELQPVLTKASDALREAYAESAVRPDVGTYQGLTDLMDQHFQGKRDLTPQDRMLLRKVAKGVKETRSRVNDSVNRALDYTERRSKNRMSPDELKADLSKVLSEEMFKDCILS